LSDLTPFRPAAPLATTARLSLGADRSSVSTHDHLRFQLDHALARDAVHTELDLPLLLRGLRERGIEGLALRSAASDRKTYLLRPDLGRALHPDSTAELERRAKMDVSSRPEARSDAVERPAVESSTSILFLLADGLSALAVERHALPLLDETLRLLGPGSWTLGPVPVVTNARVAVADPIGQLLGAQMTILLIGERPGLSSPDSLGVYLTWDPRPGRTDAERNCISNIRGDEGLSYADAALRIVHYSTEAQRLHTTGIALKDPAIAPALPQVEPLR
jgi:ethanolamine ammonia-lyase small subunit